MRRNPEIDWLWDPTLCTCAIPQDAERCPSCLVRTRGAKLAEELVRDRAAEHLHAGHEIERLPPSIITGAFGWVCTCGQTWTVTTADLRSRLVVAVQ